MTGISLRVRVATLLAGLTVVLAVVGLVCALAVQRSRDIDGHLRNRLQRSSDAVQSLFVSYLDEETGVRGYDLTAKPDFYQPFTTGASNAAKTVTMLQQWLPDAQTRTQLGTVLALHQRWLDIAATPEHAAVQSGDLSRARSLVEAGTGKQAFDNLRVAVGVLHSNLEAQVQGARRQARQATDKVLWALAIGAAALLVGIVVAGGLLRRWVLVPTSALQRQLRAVADGGYDRRIEPSGPPELAAVAADAELMRARIVTELDRSRQAIEALYQSGPVVTGLREELAATPSLVLPGLSLHGVLSPAEGILAGDWYDAVPLAGGRTALVITDVSGHGAAAGLVALRIKLALTSALSLGLGAAAALAHAAGTFAGEEERFASCVVLVVDPVAEQVTWANAGHPPPLLYTAGEHPTWEELDPTGPLLSFFAGDWEERTRPFRPGQLLLGYTDGLAEARDAEGNQLETDGILAALSALPDASPRAAVAACMAAVRSHAVDLRRDDVTVVAVSHAT